MIEIKPNIQHQPTCPYCHKLLKTEQILWQGMHVCAQAKCDQCQAEIVDDLRVGHFKFWPYTIDPVKGKVFGDEAGKMWWGNPFLQSIQNPKTEAVKISKEVFKDCQNVIIISCIDYLYGDALLKLFTVQEYLDKYPEYGVIVLVQKFLKCMVPDGVAEIWTVNLSLRDGQSFYPNLNQFISTESERFDKIYVGEARLRASNFDISRFSKVPKHDFEKPNFKVTFIWREDRLWWGGNFLFRVLKKLHLVDLGLWVQNWKIQQFLAQVRSQLGTGTYTVAGLGKRTKFPDWIEDARTKMMTDEEDRRLCQVYADSRLVIGMHGSNMLQPSGHAGLTISLMPKERWGNNAQDICFQEPDPRLSAYRYQRIPASTSISELANIATETIVRYAEFSWMIGIGKMPNLNNQKNLS